MIYKRGCDKNGPDGTCSKCGERGSCGVYWYKFMWQGKLIRESTKQGNDKVARQMEAAHRTSLAKGEVGIREKKPVSRSGGVPEKGFHTIRQSEARGEARNGRILHETVRRWLCKCDWASADGQDQRPARATVRRASMRSSRHPASIAAFGRSGAH